MRLYTRLVCFNVEDPREKRIYWVFQSDNANLLTDVALNSLWTGFVSDEETRSYTAENFVDWVSDNYTTPDYTISLADFSGTWKPEAIRKEKEKILTLYPHKDCPNCSGNGGSLASGVNVGVNGVFCKTCVVPTIPEGYDGDFEMKKQYSQSNPQCEVLHNLVVTDDPPSYLRCSSVAVLKMKGKINGRIQEVNMCPSCCSFYFFGISRGMYSMEMTGEAFPLTVVQSFEVQV